jgi:hypothetical protein
VDQTVTKATGPGVVQVKGQELLAMLKRLLHEGNVRRVVVRQGDRLVAEFPLTAGVVGAAISPVLAAIGALAALMADCTIEVDVAEQEAGSATTAAASGQAEPTPTGVHAG